MQRKLKSNLHSYQLFCFIIKIMDSQIIADLFREQVWIKTLPKQLIIPSVTFNLQKPDIQYLIDDETNPKLELFSINKEIEKGIKQLNGEVFMKCAGRSPKDVSVLERKIKSVKDVVMIVKISEYLTQGLSQQIQGCQLVLRQFREQFKNQSNQFRVYVIKQKLVGICQKNPSFIAEGIASNQIAKIQQITKIICKQLEKQQIQSINEFVFDIFCQQNGKKALIISIQPFHIHALSLFTEAQLRNHSSSQKTKPLVKIIKNESQLKEINLAEYRAGAQLANYQNLKQWIDFVQKQGQQA